MTKFFGITLLNKEETDIYLKSEAENIFHSAGENSFLDDAISLDTNKKYLFKSAPITTAAVYIWQYQNAHAQAKQLRNGSIAINKKVLNLGFGNSIVAKDLLKPTKRKKLATKILIAPWSHYWTGYYDYTIFVALNICRIKAVLSPEEFAEAIISYPLFNQPYEQQISDFLGIKKENLVDSREVDVEFETCFVGTNESWLYPSKDNVLLFKDTIESKVPFEKVGHSRIYIQRAGRRKVVNEDELMLLFTKYDIQVINDVPRPVAEQVNIYRNASFIIGPHGASFANVLWCRPRTQLVELFASNYMPVYFRYLAQILDLEYAAYCYGQPIGNEHSHVEDDILVDIDEIEQYLQQLLTNNTGSVATAG